MSADNLSENLYIVLPSDEPDVEEDEEYFARAIVYAASEEEAVDKVCEYIDMCNEATDIDSPEAGLEDDMEDLGPIYYDRESMKATLLAKNAQRPDETAFDAEDILAFETGW